MAVYGTYLRVNPPLDGKRELPIELEVITIGRGATCTIMLPGKEASRQHCAIRKVHGGVLLADLDSKNGTWVNGQKITETLLKNGDIIRVGDHEFMYRSKG